MFKVFERVSKDTGHLVTGPTVLPKKDRLLETLYITYRVTEDGIKP